MDQDSPRGIRLGPYELLSDLGEGGMGRVWHARHVQNDREVALKAITMDRAAAETYRRAFRREAEAIARVDHQLVTTIYDFGETTEHEASASNETLRKGAPWLAMEYCTAGSMADPENRPRNAKHLRDVLSEVLEALGYAHSRGILHRDLKPENILVQRDQSGSRQVRLADFGISQAVNEALVAESTAQISAARAGTPNYMPPEQIVAEWRNWGTWTDLYALGVIAYEWATGRLPFLADNWLAVGQLHLQAPVPPLEPLFPMPDEFRLWIERLLAKAPYERYERAADALHALHRFEIVDDTTTTDELPASVWASAETNVFEPTDETVDSGPFTPTAASTMPETLMAATTATLRSDSPLPTESGLNYFEPTGGEERAFHRSYNDVPPMPGDWRRTRRRASDEVLAGGVSLFGLREVPLVGRADERTRLWQTLERVRRQATSALTVIAGETGVGKSALAKWFSQRADETGAGFIVSAAHEETSAEGEGLRRMLMTIVRGHGLDRRGLHDRIALLHHFFGDPTTREHDVAALTQLMLPRRKGDPEDGVPRFQFPSDEARYETATRLIRHLARVRPIVIWLDDIHWSSESLRFAEHIIAHSPKAASIHVVATVRSDIAPQLRRWNRHLQRVLEHDRAGLIDIGPLPRDEMIELVDSLVRLAPELRDDVVRAADGRPVHAVQLIGHLVERNALSAENTGYALRDGTSVPANIEDLWIFRVKEALSTTADPIAALQAITLASMLGMRIERPTWVQICHRTGVGAADEVLENFATAGLLERVPGASRLRHDLLRFALQRRAESSPEWNMFQWMCADILEVVEPPTPDRELRRAQHLYDGEFYDEALDLLLTELSHSVIDTRVPLMRAATDLAEAALDKLTDSDPMSDRRWGRFRANRLVADRVMLETDENSREKIRSLLSWAEDHDDLQTVADAYLLQAESFVREGQPRLATEAILKCRESAAEIGDARREARALNLLAMLTNEAHDHERAREYGSEAVRLLRQLGRGMRLAWSLLTLANIEIQLEQFSRAEELASEAVAIFREQGTTLGQASGHVVFAQIYRMSGRLVQAISAAKRAIELALMVGSTTHYMATLVLVAVYSERREHQQALDVFHANIEEFRTKAMRHYAAHMEMSAMVSFAALGDFDSFDECFERSWGFWREGNFDADVPRTYRRAVDVLEEQGEFERAERVRERFRTYSRMVEKNRRHEQPTS